MFLLGFLIIGLFIGLLLGGRMRNLRSYRLTSPFLPILALLLQILLFSESIPTARWTLALKAVLHVLSYIMLLVFFALNFKKPGFAIMGLGLLLNFAVISANGGFMPTNREALSKAGFQTSGYASGTLHNNGIAKKTRLEILGDVFSIPQGIPFSNVFSIGDVLIGLGASVAASRAVLGERYHSSIVRLRNSG